MFMRAKMKIELDLKKSVEENAEAYFEKAKKAKKKIDGAEEALKRAEDKLKKIKDKKIKIKEEFEAKAEKKKRKKEWYEKFRWFTSSEGFLVIGGRDATTNEIVIKKHTDKEDIVFHTDMAGSPFFVIKTEGKTADKTLQEVADATLCYSRAWKLGLSTTDVFWVKPDQVTKEAQQGEFLPKGAFMIRGKTNYIHPKINIAVGITKQGLIMGGPLEAIKKNCEKYVEIEQGKEKSSDTAKKIRAKIGGELDDIIAALPSGGVRIKK